mmetsp:Transcript_7826/g.12232  ORF Transcript_7826/g.12232 Transcript_7826/m.12232 type:complete len:269 (+) Transcript_7826:266-1072(+)
MFRAAARLSVRSVVALIVWSVSTVVEAAFALCMIITNGKVWTIRTVVLRATFRMASLVAVVIWSVGTYASSDWSWRGWWGWRISRLDFQYVARFTLLRPCTRYLSSSLIAGVHVIKTLAVLIAKGAGLIQALASSTLAIVLEAYEPVGRRTLIAPSCSIYTSSFDADGAASSSSFIDGGVDALNGTIFELSSIRVNAHRVVLLTGEDVVFVLVIYPRDIIWVGMVQVAACVRTGRCSECGGIDKSEGSDNEFHLFEFLIAELKVRNGE